MSTRPQMDKELLKAFAELNKNYYSYSNKKTVQRGIFSAHEGKKADESFGGVYLADFNLGVKIYKGAN